ncbi:helix-turn-helix domain-containing protein [Kutzneria sp. 744]|uniref:helix-turn-helix domain-containing protein n=1 Tax=Kutzneria sp. (strain 744) TaxID=345341 RepID=UPI0005BB717F|nr:helix-turn-helix domain-containing protein [Kutzneria sp. 744]
MTMALETVLAKAGLRVTADEFLTLVEDVAKRLSPPHPEPAAYFTPEQQVALTDVGLDLGGLREDDFEPRARALAAQTVLLDTALTVTDAARVLDVDTSRIRHRLAAGRLAGWKDRGSWRLPAWQFSDSGVLPGLEVVLAAMPEDQPPLVLAGFMTTPQTDFPLGDAAGTPRAWLLAGGDPRRVAAQAKMLGTPA